MYICHAPWSGYRPCPYKFVFFSTDKGEPRHIHVVRDKALAKFWLDEVSLAKTRNFPGHELTEIEKLVVQHRDTFRKAWMTTLVLEIDPVATQVDVSDERLTVHLADGRAVSVPIGWFPRLLHGSPQQRSNRRLLGEGDAIEWEDLDEHIGVEALLASRKSGESQASLERGLGERARELSAHVGSLIEYRRRRGHDTWHWCRNCSTFPASNFESVSGRPSTGDMCNECRGKELTQCCG
jgi:Protein of unknown function (DUF2442)/Domain of unknown function (DUF4160)